MKYDKQYLYDMYNATSTEDENGDLETYENWLERQLISRIENLELLRQPLVSGECEHPYHAVLGDGEMQPAKCLKCGKVI